MRSVRIKQICLWLSFWCSFSVWAGQVGNNSPESCTEEAFIQALAAGGTVTFRCGREPFTLKLSSEQAITSNTVIDGENRITLDGQDKTRLLTTADNVLFTLKNIQLAHGFTADMGGALKMGRFNQGIVQQVTFHANKATRNIRPCDGGGAIYVSPFSTLTIEKSIFTENKANNGGAVNSVNSNLTVSDSVFRDNEAIHTVEINRLLDCGGGGALFIDGGNRLNGAQGTILIQRTVITKNLTNHYGGGIFSYLYARDRMSMVDSTVEGNIASVNGTVGGSGGGIFHSAYRGGSTLDSTERLYIENSSLVRNYAQRSGGGMTADMPISLINSTVAYNTALNPSVGDRSRTSRGIGGGLLLTHKGSEVVHSTIAYNLAGHSAGGIQAITGAVAAEQPIVRNSIIAMNRAENTSRQSAQSISINCGMALNNGGGNVQYPPRRTTLATDMECFAGLAARNPQLSELANHGGLTETVTLQFASAAIDAVETQCARVDQRGESRPTSGRCDAGAVETTGIAGLIPFAATARFSGTLDKANLQVEMKIANAEKGQVGNVYAAALFNRVWYVHDGKTWVTWRTGTVLPIYQTVTLEDMTLNLLQAQDLRRLVGGQVYVGYGLNEADMLLNNRYQLVYTVTR